MAYADQKMSGGRVVAIVIVALIHAALGYAFVTGLATNFVKKAQEKLNTFDVEEPPPPPPDEPPPPPPDTPMTPPPVVSPPPIVQNPNPPPVVIATVPTPPPVINMTPIAAPPAPPAPPAAPPAPPRVASPVSVRGNQGDWFPQDSYPPAARRAGAEGRVSVSVTVGTNGRVTACSVTSSSGNSDLDTATCNLAKRNGRFNPAKDASGNAIESTYALRGVRWQLENE
ncbi:MULTISPECIES: energy transducer TonB [unclassified Sphingomonas]|uniref:energy transducer TonB n=1 Tax=unclassified Sphingomonas TaxID=196159 RepID=UPI000E1055DB|nr:MULTISPECIES: energy transducer TonB [unclassified Sphingomonas]AXJ96297.1 energy transducer TonB [Sphingomonas sp. FARSPH]